MIFLEPRVGSASGCLLGRAGSVCPRRHLLKAAARPAGESRDSLAWNPSSVSPSSATLGVLWTLRP